MSKIYQFLLPNISCANCVEPVEKALVQLQQNKIIRNFDIDIVEKTVVIEVDSSNSNKDDVEKIVKTTIEDTGVDCETATSVDEHWIKGIIGVVSGLILLGVCFSGFSLQLIALISIAI